MDTTAVRKLLAKESEAAGGAKYLAARGKMSAAYLCDVMKGRREPAGKVLAVLDLERIVTYRRKNGSRP